MAESLAITAEIIDGVERRTAHLLAGLEAPDDGTIYEASFDGTTTVSRKPPELPSGRALLTYLLREGRPVNGRWVQIAKEAALCEFVLGLPAKGEGNN